MPKDQMAGTVTVLNISRLGDGSTTGWYAGNPIGLGRIKGGNFLIKFTGSFVGGTTTRAVANIYGGISGSPTTDFMLGANELLGSMALGTVTNATQKRTKKFATSGALIGRIRVVNAVAGTPITSVKCVIGRTLEAT